MIIAISGKMGAGKDTVGSILQFLLHTEGRWNAEYFKEYSSSQYKYAWQNYWEIRKFAAKLKQIASCLTGIPVEDIENQDVKDRQLGEEWWYYDDGCSTQPFIGGDKRDLDGYNTKLVKPTLRWLLQTLGTDAIRNNLHSNAWVNALMSEHKDADSVEVTDVDFNDVPKSNWIITDLRFPNEFQAVKKRNGVCVRVERNLNAYGSFNENKQLSHPSEIALDNHTFDYVIDNNGSMDDLIDKVQEMISHFKLLK